MVAPLTPIDTGLAGLAVRVVAKDRSGMATGIFSTVRVAGESVAIAIVGALQTRRPGWWMLDD